MVHYLDDGWISSFSEYTSEKEGTEDLFELWIVTRLDLTNNRVEAEGDDRVDKEYMTLESAATFEYDTETRERITEINGDIDPLTGWA